jgi:hypothetical protein
VIYSRFLGRGDFHIFLSFGFLICILEEKVVLRFGDFQTTSSVLSFGGFERTGFGP